LFSKYLPVPSSHADEHGRKLPQGHPRPLVRRGLVVSTGALAEALGVTPGTITTMVKSLASRGLVEHQPREGVRLTREGGPTRWPSCASTG
jgi:hypothetical protein